MSCAFSTFLVILAKRFDRLGQRSSCALAVKVTKVRTVSLRLAAWYPAGSEVWALGTALERLRRYPAFTCLANIEAARRPNPTATTVRNEGASTRRPAPRPIDADNR